MRRFWIFIIATVCTITACTLETSDNGAFDGYWQLTTIDTLATRHSSDMRTSGIYWAVQVHLLEVRNQNTDDVGNIFFRFERTATTLTLSNPIWDNRTESDAVVTDSTVMHYFGLSRLEDSFKIVQLNNSSMILENDLFRLSFRKY